MIERKMAEIWELKYDGSHLTGKVVNHSQLADGSHIYPSNPIGFEDNLLVMASGTKYKVKSFIDKEATIAFICEEINALRAN